MNKHCHFFVLCICVLKSSGPILGRGMFISYHLEASILNFINEIIQGFYKSKMHPPKREDCG